MTWPLPLRPDELSALIALAGAVLVPIEYFRQRRQQQIEQADLLEARYDADDAVGFAVLCLDWGAGQLPPPAGYREFLGAGRIKHDPELLFEALRPALTPRVEVSPQCLLYRQAFVALFNHLERVLRLWKAGRVRRSDLPMTVWIMSQLSNWQYGQGHEPDTWFLPALDAVDGSHHPLQRSCGRDGGAPWKRWSRWDWTSPSRCSRCMASTLRAGWWCSGGSRGRS